MLHRSIVTKKYFRLPFYSNKCEIKDELFQITEKLTVNFCYECYECVEFTAKTIFQEKRLLYISKFAFPNLLSELRESSAFVKTSNPSSIGVALR